VYRKLLEVHKILKIRKYIYKEYLKIKNQILNNCIIVEERGEIKYGIILNIYLISVLPHGEK